MRRALVAAGLLALTFAAAAAAKEMSVSLAAGPPALDAGETWSATLLVHGEPEMLRQATPSVTIHGPDGTIETFAAEALPGTASDGQLRYRADVVFPTGGAWRYTIVDGLTDREYEGGTVQVGKRADASTSAPARSEPPAAPGGGGGVPFWPLAAGGAVLVLLAAAARSTVRRRQTSTG